MTTSFGYGSAGTSLASAGGSGSSFGASLIGQDRLVRKEIALGLVREIVPPSNHIGLSIAPFKDVPYDDVIFDYAKGLLDGLAPARAEDAESELAQHDDDALGQGRASVIDWSLKSHYTASDISRYREYLAMVEQVRDTGNFPLTMNQSTEAQFPAKIARDTARRRRWLDNRLEWLTMTALSKGKVAYNDGKIQFMVDYQRPADQQGAAPKSGSYAHNTHDPINDIYHVQHVMNERHGVRITKGICSQQYLNSFINSRLFNARTGLITQAGSTEVDMAYVMDGWGPQAAIDVVERATGVKFEVYDSVYRTKDKATGKVVNNRYMEKQRVLFLPEESDISEFDDTDLGFGKMLTSPHPMGEWSSGFYDWEALTTDPWGQTIGNGIKAFPVFPHLDLSYTMDVELPTFNF